MGKKKTKKVAGKIIKLTLCLVLIGIIVTGAYFAIDITNDIRGINFKSVEDVVLVIEKGDTASSVASELKEMGVIKYPGIFSFLSRTASLDTRLQTGTYTLEPGMSYDEIFEYLKTTQTYRETVRVTIIEGKDVGEIIDILVEKGIGTIERYEQVVKGWDFGYEYIPEVGTENRLEGFLYPDTYDFYLDEPEESVIKRFIDNFDKKAKAVNIFTLTEENGLDFYDTIKLASIIEKESQYEPEKATIASVFYNRLAINMKLQSDATVNYFVAADKRRGSSTAETLATDNPYNSYMYYGLPPTPVSNPTISSILAAISPEETTYYYFCSMNDGTGKHVFAKTLSEHESNVNKYLK